VVVDGTLAPVYCGMQEGVTMSRQLGTVRIVALCLLIVVLSGPAYGVQPLPCSGDCNGDGRISIDEIIKGVNIALGNATVDICPAFGQSQYCEEGLTVSISCLVSAMSASLFGCPAVPQ
jgi:hypothetical protein